MAKNGARNGGARNGKGQQRRGLFGWRRRPADEVTVERPVPMDGSAPASDPRTVDATVPAAKDHETPARPTPGEPIGSPDGFIASARPLSPDTVDVPGTAETGDATVADATSDESAEGHAPHADAADEPGITWTPAERPVYDSGQAAADAARIAEAAARARAHEEERERARAERVHEAAEITSTTTDATATHSAPIDPGEAAASIATGEPGTTAEAPGTSPDEHAAADAAPERAERSEMAEPTPTTPTAADSAPAESAPAAPAPAAGQPERRKPAPFAAADAALAARLHPSEPTARPAVTEPPVTTEPNPVAAEEAAVSATIARETDAEALAEGAAPAGVDAAQTGAIEATAETAAIEAAETAEAGATAGDRLVITPITLPAGEAARGSGDVPQDTGADATDTEASATERPDRRPSAAEALARARAATEEPTDDDADEESAAPLITERDVEVRHLERGYGRRHPVLVDVSFTARSGEVTAIVGSSGEGKTTLMHILATLLQPQGGTMRINGIDAVARPTDARPSIGWMPDHVPTWPRITVRRTLLTFARMYGLGRAEARARVIDLLKATGLTEQARTQARLLSRGERQLLSFARAIVHDPQIILLDEPTSGLDEQAARLVRQTLRRLADEGHTIVLATNRLDTLDDLADHVVYLYHGVTASAAEVNDAASAPRPWRIRSLDPEALAGALRRFETPFTLDPVTQSVEVLLGSDEAANLLLARLVIAGVPVHVYEPAIGRVEQIHRALLDRSPEDTTESVLDALGARDTADPPAGTTAAAASVTGARAREGEER